MTSKQTYKITDEEFLETFTENNGSYSKTAKAIEQKYGVTYTRQSVFQRATNFPDAVKQMLELREQYLEDALLSFATDETNDINLRSRILLNITHRLSRYRLLSMRIDAAKPQQQTDEPEGIFKIGGKEFRF